MTNNQQRLHELVFTLTCDEGPPTPKRLAERAHEVGLSKHYVRDGLVYLMRDGAVSQVHDRGAYYPLTHPRTGEALKLTLEHVTPADIKSTERYTVQCSKDNLSLFCAYQKQGDGETRWITTVFAPDMEPKLFHGQQRGEAIDKATKWLTSEFGEDIRLIARGGEDGR